MPNANINGSNALIGDLMSREVHRAARTTNKCDERKEAGLQGSCQTDRESAAEDPLRIMNSRIWRHSAQRLRHRPAAREPCRRGHRDKRGRRRDTAEQ